MAGWHTWGSYAADGLGGTWWDQGVLSGGRAEFCML